MEITLETAGAIETPGAVPMDEVTADSQVAAEILRPTDQAYPASYIHVGSMAADVALTPGSGTPEGQKDILRVTRRSLQRIRISLSSRRRPQRYPSPRDAT